jgi:predicted glycosyltransferase
MVEMAKVFVAVLTWGLGHATRDIPIIKDLISRGHEITIASKGPALQLLKKEFPACTFIVSDYYPDIYPSNKLFLLNFAVNIPSCLQGINKEKKDMDRLMQKNKYDLIITDNRFGIYSKKCPSFFITHQLRLHAPGLTKPGEGISDFFNSLSAKNFDRIIVPDNKPGKLSLSGKLSVSRNKVTQDKVYYAGIMSSLQKEKTPEDIDYLVSISGPGPQREILEKEILGSIRDLKGKKMVLLGKPGESKEINLDSRTIVKSHAKREEMSELMNRAKFIITRSGYTTMMELAELEKKNAFFIPTPGQTEQEYLAAYYEKKGWFHSNIQEKLDLINDVKACRNYKGFPKVEKTSENVKRMYEELFAQHLE